MAKKTKMIEEILTAEDYATALLRLEKLMDIDPERGSVEGEELDKLASLLEAYESGHGWGFECHHH